MSFCCFFSIGIERPDPAFAMPRCCSTMPDSSRHPGSRSPRSHAIGLLSAAAFQEPQFSAADPSLMVAKADVGLDSRVTCRPTAATTSTRHHPCHCAIGPPCAWMRGGAEIWLFPRWRTAAGKHQRFIRAWRGGFWGGVPPPRAPEECNLKPL